MPFAVTVPNGMTNIDTSKIQCTVLEGGNRNETSCGADIHFDPDKRRISGTIEKISNQ